nr:hypothetical protein [uncultured Arsenicibacter sp.]
MQQTFQLNANELNANVIKAIRAMFGSRQVRIVVEDVTPLKPLSQSDLYEQTLAIRERFSQLPVDPKLDLSALADEMNNASL